METLFALVLVVIPLGLGIWGVFFSRRFSEGALRFRKAVFKMGYSDFDVRLGRVYGIFIGALLIIGGLITAAQLLL